MESKNDVNENDTTISKDNFTDNTDVQTMFEKLHKKALEIGIKQHQLSSLQYVKNTRRTKCCRILFQQLQLPLAFIVILVACGIVWRLDWSVSRSNLAQIFWRLQGYDPDYVAKERCLADASMSLVLLSRPPVDCTYCRNVSGVTRLPHITSSEFEEKYAYTGHPVVISDGAVNWTAKDVFSFDFFKEIYIGSKKHVSDQNCQFFPFRTGFKKLEDCFLANEIKANNEDGSDTWYIGWSNCDAHVGNFLREHYSKPYFLPPESESNSRDWIFMGTGFGAYMHIDDVRQPSWQAQITGHKQWALEPPIECLFECIPRVTVTVHPGEILVVDTNRWYHATRIVGDTLSITIGTEYD